MLNRFILVAFTIEGLNEKLNSLSDKYLSDPWLGFAIFVGLLIIGFWATSNINK